MNNFEINKLNSFIFELEIKNHRPLRPTGRFALEIQKQLEKDSLRLNKFYEARMKNIVAR